MLKPAEIQARITSYACCSLEFFGRYVDSKIVGDNQCAEKSWRIAMYLKYAQRAMCDADCIDPSLLAKIACIADGYCTPCGCEDVPELDCAINPAFTVISAIPFDDLPAEPENGDSYYITEGDNAGRIATWQSGDDAQWVYTTVGINNIVEDGSGEYWINYGDGPGPLFPDMTLTLVGPSAGQWQLTSQSPQITTTGGRFIQLLGYGFNVPAQGYVLWEGNEADLPLTLNLFGLPFVTLRIRYRLANGCEYLSDVLTTIPEIDTETGEPVCGTIEARILPIVSELPEDPECGSEYILDGDPPQIAVFECPPEGPCTDCLAVAPLALCIVADDDGLQIVQGSWMSSTGYYSVVRDTNDVEVFGPDDSFFSSPNEKICAYPSDNAGNPSGTWLIETGNIGSISGIQSISGAMGVVNIMWLTFSGSQAVIPAMSFVGNGSDEFYVNANGIVDMQAVDFSQCDNALILTGGTSFLFPSPFVYPSSMQIILYGISSATGIDQIANALDPSIVSGVTATLCATPTAASQANRQACYDNGSILPPEWLWDLII